MVDQQQIIIIIIMAILPAHINNYIIRSIIIFDKATKTNFVISLSIIILYWLMIKIVDISKDFSILPKSSHPIQKNVVNVT